MAGQAKYTFVYEGSFGDLEKPAPHSRLLAAKKLAAHPFELIIPIAIVPSTAEPGDVELTPFPAKIDTGFGHNLAMSHEQFTSRRWANQNLDDYSPAGDTRGTFRLGDGRTGELSMYEADLWLISNRTRIEPLEINLEEGIGLFPEFHPDEYDEHGEYMPPDDPADSKKPLGPRLPLLGQRALWMAGIKLEIDYANREFRLYKT